MNTSLSKGLKGLIAAGTLGLVFSTTVGAAGGIGRAPPLWTALESCPRCAPIDTGAPHD